MKKVGVALLAIGSLFIGMVVGFVFAMLAAEEALQEEISMYHGHGTEEQ